MHLRKLFLNPASLVTAALAVTGFFISSPALALLGGILWIGTVAFAASKNAQDSSGAPHPSELNPESRLLLRPLQQLHEQLVEIVQKNSDMTTIKIIGGEALRESREIVAQSAKLVAIRASLKQTLRAKGEAEVKLGRLSQQLNRASSESERQSLQSAIEATQREVAQYEELARSVEGIDSRLREAEVSLSEIKSRIAVTAAGARVDQSSEGDLQDLVGRLRNLNASFQEAEQSLEQEVR